MEGVEATIDTTGLSDGQHIVFVRAQDTAGNWGAITAVFLEIDSNASLPTELFFDDFETDLGWLTNPGGTDTATTGHWERANPQDTNSGGPQQLGTTVSGSFDLVTGPLAGSSVGTHDIDNGVTSIRSPDIIIPVGTTQTTLSFWYYMAHLSNATTSDFLEFQLLEILPPAWFLRSWVPVTKTMRFGNKKR